MRRVYYDYETFLGDLHTLVSLIPEKFDTIIAVARGGMTMAHMLAEYWNIRKVFLINAIGYENTHKLGKPKIFNIPDLCECNDILVVDDIADTGDTMLAVMQKLKEVYPDKNFKTATIFFRQEARFRPDYRLKKTDEWIDFFWNEELKRYNSSRKR